MTITPAKLRWDENQVPYSVDFDDVYFNAENGLAETEYVFLTGNNLRQRWEILPENSVFNIAETGFGSGLNLLATLRLWQAVAPKSARLQYVSIEQFPMRRDDLIRAHAHWPELAPFSHKLVETYPSLLPGYHRFHLTPNIDVTLIFAEVSDAFQRLSPPLVPELQHHQPYGFDAWFLDGFMPARNPDMWHNGLFTFLRRLSKSGATVATFTAVSDVRRQLASHGFTVTKKPGFARKREMLTAILPTDAPLPAIQNKRSLRSTALDKTSPDKPSIDKTSIDKTSIDKPSKPTKKPPRCWTLTQPPIQPDSSPIAIIGAGIAGATLAQALAKRGLQVDVYETNAAPAAQASGIPQVALYGKLSPDPGDLEDFVLQAMPYAQTFYKHLFEKHPNRNLGSLCGLVQFTKNDGDLDRMQRISERLTHGTDFVQLLSQAELSEIIGLPVQSGGLYFPHSGWLHGAATCAALLDHERINLYYNTPITEIQANNEAWQLCTNNKSNELPQYQRVIICAANNTKRFTALDWLPTRPIRGQVSLIPSTPPLDTIKTVLCREIQFAPASAGFHCTGSSYGLNDENSDVRDEDDAANRSKLATMLSECLAPSLLKQQHLEQPKMEKTTTALHSTTHSAKENRENALLPDTHLAETRPKAALRCSTPDYLPIVGPVPAKAEFLTQFSALRKDAKSRLAQAAPVEHGLYVNLGFGSRGYSYAPLCAEFLASQICAEPPPLPDYLRESINPARFLVRGLVRNQY